MKGIFSHYFWLTAINFTEIHALWILRGENLHQRVVRAYNSETELENRWPRLYFQEYLVKSVTIVLKQKVKMKV